MLDCVMAIEIERKFLVIGDGWRDQVSLSTVYRQAYLHRNAPVTLRVRIAGERAHLNMKSVEPGIQRSEYEYEIPLVDANRLMALCEGSIIEKTRYFVEHGGHTWEIDVYSGANAGLVIAEIELDSIDETFATPSWVGTEVSDDTRYYNAYLFEHPYSSWAPSPDPDAL